MAKIRQRLVPKRRRRREEPDSSRQRSRPRSVGTASSSLSYKRTCSATAGHSLVSKEKPEPIPRICKCLREDQGQTSPPKFVFGPLYCTEESSASGKADAWQRILEDEGENQDEITRSYLDAMREIREKARDAYVDEALNDLKGELEFEDMMIKDGCFFLQLALCILGATKELGYKGNNSIFVENPRKETLQGWIESMFLVGNQIPLVVLNKLMQQEFFQKVIKSRTWERPSDMLSKKILYDLLVNPALENINPKTELGTDQEQPSDWLHGLQLLLLGRGSGTDSTENESKRKKDLEAGVEFVSSPKLWASNLRKRKIYIWKSETARSGGIRFRNWIFLASLTLPTLKVNDDTYVLLKNLKDYETAHEQNEVRSYLRFLRELISTDEDVNFLASEGIIRAGTSEEKEGFLEKLKLLAYQETLNDHHRSVLCKVCDFSTIPWKIMKCITIIVFCLTIVQTVFSVLRHEHESRRG